MVINEEWSVAEKKFLVKKCLNEGCMNFVQYGRQHWRSKDIKIISNNCPNLKQLMMDTNMNASMQSWPVLAAPWTSLQDLILHMCPKFGGLFEGVELHQTLPNLAKIFLTEDGKYNQDERTPSFLPDLEGCGKLKTAIFLHGFFCFKDDIVPGEKLPFPIGLTKLNLMGSKFHDEYMNNVTYVEIKKVLPELENFGPCKVP